MTLTLRLQKRLLQFEDENEQTFELFPHEELDALIYQAKAEAVGQACMCGIMLSSYTDKDIFGDIVHVIESAVANDGEYEEYAEVVEQDDKLNTRKYYRCSRKPCKHQIKQGAEWSITSLPNITRKRNNKIQNVVTAEK